MRTPARAAPGLTAFPKSDALGNTPKPPLTQQVSDARLAQANAATAARAILDAALKRGIAFGTDGDELLMITPLKVPRNVRRWFEHWLNEFKSEAIDIILRENGMRL